METWDDGINLEKMENKIPVTTFENILGMQDFYKSLPSFSIHQVVYHYWLSDDTCGFHAISVDNDASYLSDATIAIFRVYPKK